MAVEFRFLVRSSHRILFNFPLQLFFYLVLLFSLPPNPFPVRLISYIQRVLFNRSGVLYDSARAPKEIVNNYPMTFPKLYGLTNGPRIVIGRCLQLSPL